MSIYNKNKKYLDFKEETPENNCFWSRKRNNYYDISELEPDDVEELELFNTFVESFSLYIDDEIYEYFGGEDYLSKEDEEKIAGHVADIEAIVNKYPMYSPFQSRPPKEHFESIGEEC